MIKIVALFLASISIFAIDTLSPLEVTIFSVYIIIVGLSAWFLKRNISTFFLVFNLVLIFISFLYDPSGRTYTVGLINRLLIASLIIVEYLIIIQYKIQHLKLISTNSKLGKMVEEREVLFREVHHRTKNNLQTISSIFSLQSSGYTHPDTQSFARKSIQRIQSISLLYDKLYKLNSNSINSLNIKDYLIEIMEYFLSIYKNDRLTISYNADIAEDELAFQKALSLGLILNELLTNSMKYAFINRTHGDIALTLVRISGGKMLFRYSDNGNGVPPASSQDSSGLGLLIIKSFVIQLEGEHNIFGENGFTFELVFSDS